MRDREGERMEGVLDDLKKDASRWLKLIDTKYKGDAKAAAADMAHDRELRTDPLLLNCFISEYLYRKEGRYE